MKMRSRTLLPLFLITAIVFTLCLPLQPFIMEPRILIPGDLTHDELEKVKRLLRADGILAPMGFDRRVYWFLLMNPTSSAYRRIHCARGEFNGTEGLAVSDQYHNPHFVACDDAALLSKIGRRMAFED
jgi:hypothetical protein